MAAVRVVAVRAVEKVEVERVAAPVEAEMAVVRVAAARAAAAAAAARAAATEAAARAADRVAAATEAATAAAARAAVSVEAGMAAATVAAATVAARAAAAGLFAAAVRSPAAHRPPARSTTALAPASRRGRLTAAECHRNAPTPAGIGRRRAAGGASSSPPRGAVCELVPHATVVASRPWPCRARWWARRCVGQGCRRRVRRRSAGKRGSLGRLAAARRLGELPQVGQRAAMQPVAGLREPPKVAARAGASL